MSPTYTTTAHGLRWLPGSNLASDIDAGFQTLAEDIDTKLLTGGKSIIATAETRTAGSYGLLTTPDRVQNVILPTDGLIAVWYQATWKDTSNGGQVGIFLGANQVKVAAPLATGLAGTSTPVTTATNKYRPLASYTGGLISYGDATTTDYADDVTTGQIVGAFGSVLPVVGGPCYIFAAAGTYDVSVQFNSGAGTLTVKNRKLWVRALAF